MRELLVAVINTLWSVWTRTSLASAGGALLDHIPDGRVRRWVVRCLDLISRAAWYQPALRARLRAGRDRPLVPGRQLEATYREALELLGRGSADVGDYLEFGVYVGTSLLCMHRASTAAGMTTMRLFGFDSFEGLPACSASGDGAAFRQGWYRASHDLVREHLSQNGVDWGRTALIPGWFDETLNPELRNRFGIERAAVILIDCDIYLSARAALWFCAPLIRDRTVIVFDEWNAGGLAWRRTGERRAFDEFVREHPELATRRLPPPHADAAVFLVERVQSGRDDYR